MLYSFLFYPGAAYFNMTEREWLALSTTEDLYGELAAVMQPRKLFLLGAAFLTGIEEWVPDAVRTAANVTREYAQGMTGVDDLLAAWVNAELASGERVWTRETRPLHVWDVCECECERCAPRGVADRKQVRQSVQEAIRDPAWFTARAASLAREIASHDAPAAQRDAIRLRVQQAQFLIVTDLVGDPFANPLPAPVPLRANPTLSRLLSVIERQETFDSLTAFALADALEEAGCDDVALLAHFRHTPMHRRGCWAVERVAGREVIELPLDDAVVWPDDYRDRRRWWW
jgi:hypothetical protein